MNKAENNKQKNTEVLRTITIKDVGVERPKKRSMVDFSTWVRSLVQGWRQGTVSCKGRSDVARSTKKPWKQKGTGRARAGSARSPIWRGGGVTFGPQKRTRTLHVNQKQKKNALNQLVFNFIDQGKVAVLNAIVSGDKPNTAQAYTILKNAGLINKKVTLFVSVDDVLTYTSFANIPKVTILFFDQPNAFNLANSDYWVFFDKDEDKFKEMVSKWH
jgi:large subunit ribosomal protein L4